MNRLTSTTTTTNQRPRAKRKGQCCVLRFSASVALLFIFAATVSAQNRSIISAQANGSLSELIDKHRVALLVKRLSVFDVRDGQSALVEEALKPETRTFRRYRMAFNTIARKLNKFLKKRKNMGVVERVEDADFVIFFNLLEYRWPLGAPYPYGELFVIVKPESGTKGRIVWKSRKVQWAGDAVDDLMDDLRLVQWNR